MWGMRAPEVDRTNDLVCADLHPTPSLGHSLGSSLGATKAEWME